MCELDDCVFEARPEKESETPKSEMFTLSLVERFNAAFRNKPEHWSERECLLQLLRREMPKVSLEEVRELCYEVYENIQQRKQKLK